MKRILRTAAWFLAAMALLLGIFLVVFTLIDYQPEEVKIIHKEKHAPLLDSAATYNFLIWNIGYAGLGSEMDFFYDGGTMTRSSEEMVKKHFKNIQSFLQKNDTVDFILLQEVDKKSRRSYYLNQFNAIDSLLKHHQGYFAKNYDVAFVPVPLKNPLGQVNSGLAAYVKNMPVEVLRYSFPGNFSWPTSLFMLDRCFQVMRFPLSGGKSLVVVNTHNSAYDDGSLRDMQMNYFKDFLLKEHQKGHYIVVGGDWNQSPPGLQPEFGLFDTLNYKELPSAFPAKDWKWVYDAKTPTNRRLQIPYQEGVSLTTVIDFYLCSPGISIKNIQTIDLNFVDTDHQPVLLSVELN